MFEALEVTSSGNSMDLVIYTSVISLKAISNLRVHYMAGDERSYRRQSTHVVPLCDAKLYRKRVILTVLILIYEVFCPAQRHTIFRGYMLGKDSVT